MQDFSEQSGKLEERNAEDLLSWYDLMKRDLPWRKSSDPYAVWISEIMLQQTQVATVRPYFETFMDVFPNIQTLAKAPLDEVLIRWSGLGYYRRARMLHAAAQQLASEERGLPSTYQELLLLPGIGSYTAAAIASIAFGERVPVLDGNVERVMSRLLAFEDNPKRSASKRHLTHHALKLVSPRRPGDSNQALMELGATICRPKTPKCMLCPLQDVCQGKSTPGAYPNLQPRKKTEKVNISVALACRKDGRALLFRRPESSSLLAGMWELPHVVLNTEATPEKAEDLKAISQDLAKTYGGSWQLEPAGGTIKHSITHRAITFYIHSCHLDSASSEVRQRRLEAAWIGRDDQDRFALSSAVTKVLSAHLGWA